MLEERGATSAYSGYLSESDGVGVGVEILYIRNLRMMLIRKEMVGCKFRKARSCNPKNRLRQYDSGVKIGLICDRVLSAPVLMAGDRVITDGKIYRVLSHFLPYIADFGNSR